MPRSLFVSVCLAGLATATAAAAQNAPAPAKPDQAPAAGQVSLGEIVVTAQRRGENVQRTALAVQALPQAALERANVTRSEDITRLAPSVQIGSAGPFAQPYIRGVGNFSVQVSSEGAVATNLDGVYISRPWASRGVFYDLDRVEVLEGPQGTLYGRNTSGGAINLITAKPDFSGVHGFGEIEGGDYSLVRGTGAINVPLSDTVAIRAAGQVTSRSGYLSDGYDDDKTEGGRVQVLWRPSSNLSLLLNGSYQHLGGKGEGGVLSPQLPGNPWRSNTDPAVVAIYRAEPGLGPFLNVPLTDGYIRSSVWAISGELNWKMGFGTLTVLPAYRRGEFNALHYAPGFHAENHNGDDQASLEVRFSHEGEKLKLVLGAFGFYEGQDALQGKQSLIVLQGPGDQFQPYVSDITRSYAGFGQATYSLTDRLRVTAGLRYTYEEKTDNELVDFYGLPSPPPSLNPCPGTTFDLTTPVPPNFCAQHLAFNADVRHFDLSYKAGLEYDVAPQSMAYVNISTGFKSGGFYSAPPPNTFAPETVFAVDAGIKNRFFDNRLQLNVEVFDWTYTNKQESYVGPTTIPTFFSFITTNAGKAESYGAQVDARYLLTSQDEFSANVQYDATKYRAFQFQYASTFLGPPVSGCLVGPVVGIGQTVDCSGKQLVRAPTWTGTAAYTHTFDLGSYGKLDASLSTQFATASWMSAGFTKPERQRDYAIGDVDLTYKPSRTWVLSAYVHNISNAAVANQAFVNAFVSSANPLLPGTGPERAATFETLRPPRTFGVRVRYNF